MKALYRVCCIDKEHVRHSSWPCPTRVQLLLKGKLPAWRTSSLIGSFPPGRGAELAIAKLEYVRQICALESFRAPSRCCLIRLRASLGTTWRILVKICLDLVSIVHQVAGRAVALYCQQPLPPLFHIGLRPAGSSGVYHQLPRAVRDISSQAEDIVHACVGGLMVNYRTFCSILRVHSQLR